MELAMTIPLRAVAPVATDADQAAERELVERCLAGDREAFAPVVRRYGPGLFAFCSRMVGPAVGEELAQECFARAYAGLAGFRNDSRLKQWLYRIALNLCRDHLKSGKTRESAVGDFVGPFEPADNQAGPEARALGREAIRSLQRAVEQLSPKYKEAFVLKHVENLSYEEMREIVRMPIPALKVRVHRAREMLKRLMEEEEQGESR
jgi:RNA polymerase sigma-70 factor (ECF subfamily)